MIGTRVNWITSNANGWAGSGRGRVIAYDGARPMFGSVGSRKGGPPVGPAACVKLDHNGLSVWVPPNELEVLTVGPDEVLT